MACQCGTKQINDRQFTNSANSGIVAIDDRFSLFFLTLSTWQYTRASFNDSLHTKSRIIVLFLKLWHSPLWRQYKCTPDVQAAKALPGTIIVQKKKLDINVLMFRIIFQCNIITIILVFTITICVLMFVFTRLSNKSVFKVSGNRVSK